MLQASGNKRAAIPIEMLALLVVSLVVVAVIIIFFKGGLGEIGKKFGLESRNVTSQTGGVTRNMSEGVNSISGVQSGPPTPTSCPIPPATTCNLAAGVCVPDDPTCLGMGGVTTFPSGACSYACCC